MSREQVVTPVVYGQHVPSDAADPLLEAPIAGAPDEVDSGRFTVRLDNFTGPFDLLLQLIGKHKLDVTEVALHQVTDDFIAYIRGMGDDWDLGEASEFLLVAATLLDLKAARLLPSAEVEDEDDLALLEAGDLLFARLLQYKAYKEAAAVIADLEHPCRVGIAIDGRFQARRQADPLRPSVLLDVAERFLSDAQTDL